MISISKIPSGVLGLDSMLGGGIPFPSIILIYGEMGTGKTTLSAQFLCKGAEMGEKGLYISAFGKNVEDMEKSILSYDFFNPDYLGSTIKYVDLGFYLQRLGKHDLSTIEASLRCDETCGEMMVSAIKEEIERWAPRRIVIDSLQVLERLLQEGYRPFLLQLAALIKELRTTTLIAEETFPFIQYPSELASITDGVIILYNKESGCTRQRFLEILKMTGTAHRRGKHAADISSKGLVVYPGL
jgi:circadian clock protein KaiC